MKFLKNAWKWLSGKKTNIGMGMMLIAQGIQVFLPEMMTTQQIDFLQTTGALIGGFGLAHKTTKTGTMQKIATLIKPKKK